MLMRARTKPHTSEYDFPHFSARREQKRSFASKEAVGRNHEGDERASLLKARCEILFLLRPFVGGKYLLRILVPLRPAVNIRNTNIDNAFRAG